MREKDYSFIDFFITFIFLFYFEYKICLDLFDIYDTKEIKLIYFLITFLFLFSIMAALIFNKLKHDDIKTYIFRYLGSWFFCIIHGLVLLHFISILSFIFLLIIQCVLNLAALLFIFFINNKSDFDSKNFLLFLIAYITYIILGSSIVVYCNI